LPYGNLPMSEVVAARPICDFAVPETGVVKYQLVDPDLFSPRARVGAVPEREAAHAIFATLAVLWGETSEKTAGISLLFRSPERRQPRISAGFEASLADNFWEEQRKTARWEPPPVHLSPRRRLGSRARLA
jgi:hypothetical protein